MAAAELLAPQTTAANSADVVIAAGGAANFGLKTAADGPIPFDEALKITRKSDGGKYADTGVWLTANSPNAVITGEGSYRVEKPATRAAIGVYTG